ncbi:protein TolR [Magnetococcales bacterium HHB-1]
MGMGVRMSEGGGDRFSGAMSEINVTPLVDIMLVLLIIFMVTAPLLTQGVEVNLPQASANPISSNQEPIVISVKPDGSTYIENKRIPLDELAAKVKAIRRANPQLPIYVRGDEKAVYGAVMRVMAGLQMAGIEKVGLITEPQS